ncbi:MAG: sensor histidine kinase [Vulcanimicrobiota bacterium]
MANIFGIAEWLRPEAPEVEGYFREIVRESMGRILVAMILVEFVFLPIEAQAPAPGVYLIYLSTAATVALCLALLQREISAEWANPLTLLLTAVCSANILLSHRLRGVQIFTELFEVLILAVGVLVLDRFWASLAGLTAASTCLVVLARNDPKLLEHGSIIVIALGAAAMFLQLRRHVLAEQFRLSQKVGRQSKRLEAAIATVEQSRSVLAHRVAQKRSQLLSALQELERGAQEQSELRQQLENAKIIDSLGNLAGSVAHDFKNVLTVVGGGLELLEAVPNLSPASSSCLTALRPLVERTSDLTRKLVAFSRKQELMIRPWRVADLLEEHWPTLMCFVQERIETNLEVECPEAVIRVDGMQFGQVLLHLVTNACEAMPNGGRLSLTVYRQAVGVAFRLTDSGVGFRQELSHQLFEPFYSTKRGAITSGLGLSAVRGIVDQHGGKIEASSCPGGGSTFQVWFEESTNDSI